MTGTVCHMSATDVIEAAQSQIGYKEGRSNGYWNNDQKYSRAVPGLGWSNWQPWCATFVCWTFYRTGQLALLPEVSASCDVMMNGWKRKGRWQNAPVLGISILTRSMFSSISTFLLIVLPFNSHQNYFTFIDGCHKFSECIVLALTDYISP